VFGARPLKRYLQRELETRIGRQLIAGQVPDGSTVQVDVAGGELKITPWLQRRPKRDRRARPRSIATSTLDGSRQHAEIARRTATGRALQFSCLIGVG